MYTIEIVLTISLCCCSLAIVQCLPQPHHDHSQLTSVDQLMIQKRQDISQLLMASGMVNDQGGNDAAAVSMGNLIDWSGITKSRLTPSAKQSFSPNPFGLFKQKAKQSSSSKGSSSPSSSSSSSLADELKAALNGGEFYDENEENWIKAYTGPAIGGLASFNGADYDEGSSLSSTVDTLNPHTANSNTNNDDDRDKGKSGKKSKAWWAKFFDRQRGKSDHPSDPVNYGINPHGRYPTTDIEVKPQSVGSESDENRPILNNMRKWLTKLWKPNEGGAASVTGPGVTNQQDY